MGIQHAAGPPGIGLLQPVLVRWQSKAAPLSVFALPAVQTILYYKWSKWAKNILMVEFTIYMLWLLSTIIFVFALIVTKSSQGSSKLAFSGGGIGQRFKRDVGCEWSRQVEYFDWNWIIGVYVSLSGDRAQHDVVVRHKLV